MNKPLVLSSALAFAFAVSLAETAHAEATIDISTLPRAESVPVPERTSAPKRVGAGEKAAGFFVGHIAQHDTTVLVSNKRGVDEFMGTVEREDLGAQQPCFSALADTRWRDGGEPQVYLRSGGGGGDSEVVAFRRTQLELTGETAVLHEAVAWVDPMTRGARLVGAKDLPLKKLSSQYGVILYVAATSETVQFVIVEDRSANGRNGAMVERPGGGFDHSSCGTVASLKMPKKGEVDVATMYVAGDLGPSQKNSPNFGNGIEMHRARGVAVQGSTSFLGRDAAPVVTWSMGWYGHEGQTMMSAKSKTKS